MTVGEGKGIMHSGFHFTQKANGFKSLLAGKNIYDVLQQTNKPPVPGIGRGGGCEVLQHWSFVFETCFPAETPCTEGDPGKACNAVS